MDSNGIMIQLISKSKEFCYMFYMLLDKLQPKLNTPNSDQPAQALANLLQAFGCKMDPVKDIATTGIKHTANAVQADDETSISQNSQELTHPLQVESKNEVSTQNKSKKASRYNGYLLYYKSIIGEMKSIYPTYGLSDMAKVISKKWKELTNEERYSWNVKGNPLKYNKIAKRKKNMLEKRGSKKIKVDDDVIKDSRPLIPVKSIEKIHINNEVSMTDVQAEKKQGSTESKTTDHNLNDESISNQRAELKKKLLHESKDQHEEIFKKASLPIMIPGGTNSSLF